MEDLRTGQAISRRYRNRRIGEFLKEIDLSEKKSTGITKVLRALESNGSPPPEFKTDEDRNYLIVTIRQHEAFKAGEPANEPVNEPVNKPVYEPVNEPVNELVNELVNEPVNELVNRKTIVWRAIKEDPKLTIKQIADKTGIAQATVKREIKSLKQSGMIIRKGSDKTGQWEVVM